MGAIISSVFVLREAKNHPHTAFHTDVTSSKLQLFFLWCQVVDRIWGKRLVGIITYHGSITIQRVCGTIQGLDNNDVQPFLSFQALEDHTIYLSNLLQCFLHIFLCQ